MLGKSLLEVERKFCSNTTNVSLLRQNLGRPSFRSLQRLGNSTFSDTYYDQDSRLSDVGIYLRKRTLGKTGFPQWQLKLRQAGGFRNSSFLEFEDLDKISEVLRRRNLCKDAVATKDFGLVKVASFVTKREAWLANDRFQITFDAADFGHKVGEVELQEQAFEGAEAEAKRLSDSMNKEIQDFMAEYCWFHCDGNPIGKLEAFYKVNRTNEL